MTKQQARERAIARKQVAGQGTLDQFLSPSQEKQVQEQLARSSKQAVTRNEQQDLDRFKQGNKQVLPPGTAKRQPGNAERPQGRVKRPRKQMVRLYDVESAQAGNLTFQSGCMNYEKVKAVSLLREDVSLLSEDEEAFQPAKRTKGSGKSKGTAAPVRATMKPKSSKANLALAHIDVSKEAAAAPTVTFQSFSYSKGDSKHSKEKGCVLETEGESGEVSSVQRAKRTKSSTAYAGMY